MSVSDLHDGGAGLALEACGLRFAYGSAPVLRGLDLSLAPGQMVALLGPNGCGKSTLLGLLAGLLKPQAGEVRLGDKPVRAYRRRELAALLALVPQSLELAPGLTVEETVLGGRFAHLDGRVFESPQDLEAARQALALTGLEGHARRLAGTLSGGERQRLALARALASGASWLLLDEPTSALDPEHQLRVMGLLESLCHRQGRSVCLASHDLNLASLFCDRLALLHGGRALAVGSPRQVLTPELLARVYGVKAMVDQEPSRGRPRVSLAAPRF